MTGSSWDFDYPGFTKEDAERILKLVAFLPEPSIYERFEAWERDYKATRKGIVEALMPTSLDF